VWPPQHVSIAFDAPSRKNTRFAARHHAPGSLSDEETVPAARTPRLNSHDLDPRLISVARPARAITPRTRIGFVTEVLRMSPYRIVPVVDGEAPGNSDDDGRPRRLIGLIREEDSAARSARRTRRTGAGALARVLGR
jgi:hypothetical protein